MNTKIIAPPLANSITMGLAAAVFLASVSMAAAQERYPAGANQYYGMYEPAQRALGFSRGDRFRYGHSGTRGRDGLGASSVYPEGPGNVSD